MQEVNMSLMTEEQKWEAQGQILRDRFTLEDFLACEETREVLVNEHLWKFERDFLPKLENFYRELRDEMQERDTTLLYYDRDDSFACRLSAMVYNHIAPEYDLSIFYDSPHLAQPLIEQYEEIKARKKKEAMEKRRASYRGNASTSRQFDWATKTYK